MYNRKAEIGNSSPDINRKRRKIIVGVLVIVIGLPVAFILTAFRTHVWLAFPVILFEKWL